MRPRKRSTKSFQAPGLWARQRFSRSRSTLVRATCGPFLKAAGKRAARRRPPDTSLPRGAGRTAQLQDYRLLYPAGQGEEVAPPEKSPAAPPAPRIAILVY